jgi:CRISPR-associated endonuclease Csn1
MGNYRFAFDLGTTSIGWAVYELNKTNGRPVNLSRIGVRIFDDGLDSDGETSNAKNEDSLGHKEDRPTGV